MKRVFMFLIILCLLISGCGSKEETPEQPDEDVNLDIDQEKDSTVIKSEDGTEVEVSDMKKSLDLPDDYPKDILPLYSEEFIAVAMKNPDGSHSIIGMTKGSVDDVQAYYEQELEEATVITTQQETDFYMTMGEIKGATYTIMVQPQDEEEYPYTTMYTLIVVPGQTMDDETSEQEDSDEADETDAGEKVEAAIVVPDDVQWPSDYPEKILPIYPTGATEADHGEAGMLAIMTEDEIEDVLAFYKELLVEAPDFSEFNMKPMFMMSGTLEGISIQLTFSDNEAGMVDERFNTLIQIMYE